jgi:hypothetical protein
MPAMAATTRISKQISRQHPLKSPFDCTNNQAVSTADLAFSDWITERQQALYLI